MCLQLSIGTAKLEVADDSEDLHRLLKDLVASQRIDQLALKCDISIDSIISLTAPLLLSGCATPSPPRPLKPEPYRIMVHRNHPVRCIACLSCCKLAACMAAAELSSGGVDIDKCMEAVPSAFKLVVFSDNELQGHPSTTVACRLLPEPPR